MNNIKTTRIRVQGTEFTIYTEGEDYKVATTAVTEQQYAQVMGMEGPNPQKANKSKIFTVAEYESFMNRLKGSFNHLTDFKYVVAHNENKFPRKRVVKIVKERVASNYDGSYAGFMQAEYYGGGAVDDVIEREEVCYEITDGFPLILQFHMEEKVLTEPSYKDIMLSVAIGDICGSFYELRGNGTKDVNEVNLLRDDTDYTDDTVCAFACAEALLKGIDVGKNLWERCQPEIQRGFGNRFRQWLMDENRTPYVSQGTNGSAMRCMAAGILARTEEECKEMAFRIAEPTHNHPDCIKGAEVVALAIYYLLRGWGKFKISKLIEENYFPRWRSYGGGVKSLSYVLRDNQFSCLCEDTVPLALICFLASEDYVDCLKKCIATGSDSDTIAAMASPMAYIYYRELPSELVQLAKSKLPQWMLDINEQVVPDEEHIEKEIGVWVEPVAQRKNCEHKRLLSATDTSSQVLTDTTIDKEDEKTESHNEEAAIEEYQTEIAQCYKELLDKHGPQHINLIIRDVVDMLVDKVADAKKHGLQNEACSKLVSDTIIQPYQVLNMLLDKMMSGTGAYLKEFVQNTQDYPLSEVYKTIDVVEMKLELDDMQQAILSQTRRIVESAMTMMDKKKYAGLFSSISSHSLRKIVLTSLFLFALIVLGLFMLFIIRK